MVRQASPWKRETRSGVDEGGLLLPLLDAAGRVVIAGRKGDIRVVGYTCIVLSSWPATIPGSLCQPLKPSPLVEHDQKFQINRINLLAFISARNTCNPNHYAIVLFSSTLPTLTFLHCYFQSMHGWVLEEPRGHKWAMEMKFLVLVSLGILDRYLIEANYIHSKPQSLTWVVFDAVVDLCHEIRGI